MKKKTVVFKRIDGLGMEADLHYPGFMIHYSGYISSLGMISDQSRNTHSSTESSCQSPWTIDWDQRAHWPGA
ncbi:hypothetical protein N7447_001205 [Penicillium robsamsonii]|uniref:uncharacterized protein n=1 Tax=Penicillium robsamsonii TaxID=1792511 RepID=UPI0025493599|nr:uncharacterized protein N7447_001205 [Penicillium robsamsonii]KAJ5835179.1 hypothetical protein N7447_001205 [Penicillium robsamsonii]